MSLLQKDLIVMATTSIINAAPMTILRGTQDLSIRPPPLTPEIVPTHLPKVFIYAQKGPSTPQLVVGNMRNMLYGDTTFDDKSKFATHQTVLSNVVNAQGNTQMIERIIPTDAGPRSNLLLSLDVLEINVPQYQRNTDGSFKLDPVTQEPMPTVPATTKPGYQVKWVVSSNSVKANEINFGAATQVPGDQTNGAVQSTRYPILHLQASSYGAYGNNVGIRLFAPTLQSRDPVSTRTLQANKVYPFRAGLLRRLTSTATPTLVRTKYNEPVFDFTFKQNVVNPLSNLRFSIADSFLDRYENSTDTTFPLRFGDYGDIRVYNTNVETLVNMFYDAEYDPTDPFSDFTGDPDEKHLFNFLSGVTTKNTPYNTFVFNRTDADSILMNENTVIYSAGGSDGTMSLEDFSLEVRNRMQKYADPEDEIMDTAKNVESIFYDTGFDLETKYELCKFIAERKDTAVVLSTYEVDGPELTAIEEQSLALSLKVRLQMYPESDYFGTSTMRGVVMGRYGVMRNSEYRKKLPLTIELADKAAKLMGAANGIWKETALFDKAPNNEITLFAPSTVNVTFTSAGVRNRDWAVGLNWVQSYSRKSLFFPTVKTVYDNDSSILNSFFVMMAAVELQKVGERVWRKFTGSISLTDDEFLQAINQEVEKQTIGRFANLFKIVPKATMTDDDKQRGYSWTLPIELYANQAKTVMTLDVVGRNMNDFVEA